jgi:CheY-like chemotaxis protein
MSILIVDDNRVSLKIIELNLRKHRHKTITTKSGKEAFEILMSNPDIRLVIADIMMPEMDGLELLERIKKNLELQSIPVIICTALKDIETVQKAIRLGCRHYITKPVNPGQLQQKVCDVLGYNKSLLRDKWQVMSHLNLDVHSYEEIILTFAALIKDKAALIERHLNNIANRDFSKDIGELLESASMLGADRLKNVIETITQQKESDGKAITKDDCLLLLEELKRLESELPSHSSQMHPVSYASDKNQRRKPKSEKTKNEVLDMSKQP